MVLILIILFLLLFFTNYCKIYPFKIRFVFVISCFVILITYGISINAWYQVILFTLGLIICLVLLLKESIKNE